MRFIRRLLAVAAALALVAVPAGAARADPPAGVTPRPADVAGVGSDTIGFLLDQLSHDYNKAHAKSSPLLYSWDPVNPVTGQTGDPITTKAGCPATPRPDGSSAGISALEAGVTDPNAPKDFCVDYAGSSRGPATSDPSCSPGGICFISLAGDAVTWAARDQASGGTDAPATLTRTQLKNIYLCKITNWDKVGGQNAPIEPFLPQASSGTRAFWLTALGGSTPITPGPCVSDNGNALQDNQGIDPVLDSPEAIVPYSVADYIAQVYHDAACTNSSCTGSPACTPAAGQNLFGCDEHGVLGLREIGGTRPLLPWPPPSPPCASCAINPAFSHLFQRTVYDVVRYASTSDHIPAYLEPFFAASTAPKAGYFCTNPTAKKDIKAYGFLAAGAALIASSSCGTPNH
ncbi:MAG TPA: substrate-binding domain-containing protein [Streptosporangiaceae bacterium]|jgi:ABC-type phosphate transport system substrate-binding protein